MIAIKLKLGQAGRQLLLLLLGLATLFAHWKA